MAGPRKAVYVSLPLAPGVFSNTTGRGAKVRQNYMLWDRWKDASWVRWHKQLAEKVLGWAYQALQGPAGPVFGPTAPILLMHFDGDWTDSSGFGNNGAPNTPNVAIGTSTPTPKFGTGEAQFTGVGGEIFAGGTATVPFSNGAPLDLTASTEWTVDGWVYCPTGAYASGALFLTYGGGPATNGGTANGFTISTDAGGNLVFSYYGVALSPSGSIGGHFSANTWTHYALVRNGSTIYFFVQGVMAGSATVTSAWAQFNAFITVGGGYNFTVNSPVAGGVFSLDELRVTPAALWTSNFTPPTTAGSPGSPVPQTYLGLARALKDWTSIDGQYWIAIGTHLKLYIVNNLNLYDITPSRKTSNLTNPFTTTNTSDVVTVVDTDHRAATGDYIAISSATTVGGLNLNGEFPITVVDPNTYTIIASGNANANATGGGNPSITYDIGAGLPSNGELLGYGTGVYGALTYGTPRAPGTGVFARLRTWSLDNYGQDLIASESDGEIYWWQRNSGPNTRAQLILNAPQGVQRLIVDAAQRVLIALGCTDVTSAYDPLLVRWCSLDDITDWIPTDLNTAGDYQLTVGSRIVTGLKTKGQNLIWTDIHLYRMVFVGGTDIYDFIPAGVCSIVGPNAAVDVDGVAYFMGFDNFYNYSGTLSLFPCEVWETVFDPNRPTSLLRSQSEKVVCYTYEPKTEITWLYPSIGGSGENDRYVIYNWDEGVWYYGSWNRTCAQGRAAAMGGYPYGVNAGYLYQHEIGTDAVEFAGTTALGCYLESLDITVGGAKSEFTMGGSDARFAIGGSDAHLRLLSMLPDWDYFTGTMNLTIKTKDRPQDPSYVIEGPVTFDSTVDQIDIDAHGSQIVIRLDNYTNESQPSVGCSFRMGILQALALPYAKR